MKKCLGFRIYCIFIFVSLAFPLGAEAFVGACKNDTSKGASVARTRFGRDFIDFAYKKEKLPCRMTRHYFKLYAALAYMSGVYYEEGGQGGQIKPSRSTEFYMGQVREKINAIDNSYCLFGLFTDLVTLRVAKGNICEIIDELNEALEQKRVGRDQAAVLHWMTR